MREMAQDTALTAEAAPEALQADYAPTFFERPTEAPNGRHFMWNASNRQFWHWSEDRWVWLPLYTLQRLGWSVILDPHPWHCDCALAREAWDVIEESER